MGNLLVVIPASEYFEGAEELFQVGIAGMSQLKSLQPNSVYKSEFAYAASFPRLNGTGSQITVDSSIGAFLACVGTWFHSEGFSSGDEALLLERFVKFGVEHVARGLEGFFAIVFGDPRSHEVSVITDIIGSCHFFVRTFEHAVVLSSSTLQLASLGGFTLDPIGCQEFIATASITENRTFFKEVKRLEPATCYRYGSGKLKSSVRYWRLNDLPLDSLRDSEAASALKETVIGAAQRINKVFPRTVCDLTGGYDSRFMIAAFLSGGLPITTAVSGSLSSPDVLISKALASRENLPNIWQNPNLGGSLEELQDSVRLTDGAFDVVEYSRIYTIQKTLSEQFDISVNGYAGEHGRGYGWEVLFPHAGERIPIDSRHLAKRRLVPTAFDPSIFLQDQRIDFVEHFHQVVDRTNQGLGGLPNTAQYDYCLLMLRASPWQGRIASATNQIWPCLSFFLLRSVLDVMLMLDSTDRSNSYIVRRILVEMQPRLANYPLDSGYPAIPLTWQNFYRFWPIFPMYGNRAANKVLRLLGRGSASSDKDPSPPRLLLWKDHAVRELLGKEHLLCADILESKKLADFLQRSTQREFPYERQWSRLLSLEVALHKLTSMRSF